MATRLFIENQEVELDKTVQFAITKQFEDLSNPTAIINDWSKTVSIPFTQNNNNLFGHIYNPDRLIVAGSGSIGIYFDPTKKLNFRLQDGDNVIMTGYAKMNEIKQKDGKGTYEITLFGELGKVFQELKNITFDNSTDDTTYLINGSDYVEEQINRSLIYSIWTTEGQTQSKLYPKWLDTQGGRVPHPAYKVTDIIGFAPNNSYSEDFKYDTYQQDLNSSNTFDNQLGSEFTADTGVEPKTIISNGMLPREIGEYRSYLQLPYIYWNKLFQLFQYKAEELTGYSFDLDSSWFNTTNPYWYNLVYMLKSFTLSNKEELYNNLYGFKFNDNGTSTEASLSWVAPDGNTKDSECWQEEQLGQKFLAVGDSSTEVINICDYASPVSHWQLKENSITTFKIPVKFYIIDWGVPEANNPYLVDGNGLIVEVIATGASGYTQTQKFIIQKSTSSIYEPDAIKVIKDTKLLPNIWSNFEAYFNCDPYDFGESVSFSFKAYWKTTTYPSTFWQAGALVQHKFQFVYFPDQSIQTNTMINTFKSNSRFTLNDLWNNDYNLFDEVIKYCKMYRISISIDEVNKKIVFQPFNKYFENYTIEDWTDKVDKSKDFNIVPVIFDSKYILFNYKDSNTKLGKEYKEKFGVNYGDYSLKTEYNFNNETKKLFDDITPSIVNTDNVLSWKNLYTNHNIVYSFPAEIYVYNKDKDNKQIDLFGAYYFYNGLQSFSTEAALNLVTVKISDDTPFQLANNTYFYSRNAGYRLLVYTYPKLDIVNGDNLCVFNAPMENYTYMNNYSGKNSIYNNFWRTYINERYNIQNKKVTCYVKLTPLDWVNFKFNKFVKINNQLYMVNKIYDYNITSNSTTKVDLITIQDISGYTN